MITNILESKTVSIPHQIKRMSYSELEDSLLEIRSNIINIDNTYIKDIVKYYTKEHNPDHRNIHLFYQINDKLYFPKRIDLTGIDNIYFATPSNNDINNTHLASDVSFDLLMNKNKLLFSPMSYFHTLIGKKENVGFDWDTWEKHCCKFMLIFNTLVINCISNDLSESINYINLSKGVTGEILFHLKHNNSNFYVYDSYNNKLYEMIDITDTF